MEAIWRTQQITWHQDCKGQALLRAAEDFFEAFLEPKAF